MVNVHTLDTSKKQLRKLKTTPKISKMTLKQVRQCEISYTVYEAREHAQLEREHTQLLHEIEREIRREDREKRETGGGSWWG